MENQRKHEVHGGAVAAVWLKCTYVRGLGHGVVGEVLQEIKDQRSKVQSTVRTFSLSNFQHAQVSTLHVSSNNLLSLLKNDPCIFRTDT